MQKEKIMNVHADPTQKDLSVGNAVSQKLSSEGPTLQFVDNRPEVVAQDKWQAMVNKSSQVKHLKVIQKIANDNSETRKPFQLKSLASGTSVLQQEPIQLKSYKTDVSKNRSGLVGHVDVQAGATSIDLKGKLIDDEGAGIPAKGIVYIPEYKVDEKGLTPPQRIREQEGTSWQNYWKPSDALRVQNLSAEPRGMKLGQLLTYYHGLEAKKRGKPFVIAMKVSDARGPFYTPLGFKDYNGSKSWSDLNAQHIELEATLRREEASMSVEEILDYQKRMAALKDAMEDSSMIISSNDLVTNSQQKFATTWDED